MDGKVRKERQDLTYLKWSHIRSSSGTAGTFLKSESSVGGDKIYYKLSNFDPVYGVIGHECINEIIVDRLLTHFEVDHLSYELINADIEIEGRIFQTWLCASRDFKKHGESKAALDDYYRVNALKGESHYDFCVRQGWKDYIDTMIAVDYIILNRDRHGANIEVLRNAPAHSLRIAPLFDHGISLMYSCTSEEEAKNYNIMEDKRCNNFIGGYSCFENLELIKNRKDLFAHPLVPEDKRLLFEDLDGVLAPVFIDRIWEMIYRRYQIYENL
ncbi:MAG: hypothetical protein IJ106_11635 [Parasporobacterium sp.]|nr:hypothetical protein [Parasporobacterium sp.]